MTDKDIQKELDSINKRYGTNTISFLDENNIEEIEAISTSSVGLDFRLGVGGIPRGRVTEIAGMESAGKSSLAAHVCAEAQKEGGLAAYIDMEHEVSKIYFKNLGVDLARLAFSQPETLEEGLAVLETLLETNKFDVIVLDSVAQGATKAEIEGDLEDHQMGVKARLMSKHLRRVTSILSKTKTAVIYINQFRNNISGYGSPKTTPAGLALKFKAAVRIELRKITNITQGPEKVGIQVRATTVKNKLASPFQEWEFTIIFGKGIVAEYDIIELATQLDIIQKKGSWYSYNGENIGQGMNQTSSFLRENEEIKEEIKQKIRAELTIQAGE